MDKFEDTLVSYCNIDFCNTGPETEAEKGNSEVIDKMTRKQRRRRYISQVKSTDTSASNYMGARGRYHKLVREKNGFFKINIFPAPLTTSVTDGEPSKRYHMMLLRVFTEELRRRKSKVHSIPNTYATIACLYFLRGAREEDFLTDQSVSA